MNVKDFEALKQKLEKAKENKIRLEGNLEQIMGRLKSEFGIASIEEADKYQKKMEDELAIDEERLEESINEINNIVDWNNI